MTGPPLPPEILDDIVNLLHDDTRALKQCCLVSKSWVQRTRRHLFADVALRLDHLKLWKETFLDPINSPAHHVRTLTINSRAFQGTNTEDDKWIEAFTRVTRLFLTVPRVDHATFFTPFYKMSSSLESLHVRSRVVNPQVFDLVRSLPLLEDLAMIGGCIGPLRDHKLEGPQNVVPPKLASPVFTGRLWLCLESDVERAARQLLDLPNGLHFRRMELSSYGKEDIPPVMELVSACSDTLEHLSISIRADFEPTIGPIDLSKAKKLEEVAFGCFTPDVGLIIMALKTITSSHRNLQQISIRLPSHFGHTIPATIEQRIEAARPGMQWSDLDRHLIEFWESRSIRIRILCPHSRPAHGKRGVKDWVPYLLPELTKKGVIDLVETGKPQSL